MKTLKTLAIFCLSALLFTGCGNDGEDTTSGLVLSADKYDLYDTDMESTEELENVATFTITYNGSKITDINKVDFVDENNQYAGDLLTFNNETGDITFSSTEQRVFCFKAGYGSLISNEIRITVSPTPPPAPEAPQDANPSKTNFKRRVLLTQFTGTGCRYCPLMINALHTLMGTPLANDVVLTVAHLYNATDPAYLYKAPTLSDAMGVRGYPHITADMKRTASYTNELNKQEPDYAYLQKLVQFSKNRVDVKGGIALNTEYKPEEGYVMVTALVKAKSTNEFRVGAWLVEDEIEGAQSNPNGYKPVEGANFDLHSNCIRVANSRRSDNDFTGVSANTIQAGKTAVKSFALPLLPNGKGGATTWNHSKLRVVVFISTKENGSWHVNNVVTAPVSTSGEVTTLDFEYTE